MENTSTLMTRLASDLSSQVVDRLQKFKAAIDQQKMVDAYNQLCDLLDPHLPFAAWLKNHSQDRQSCVREFIRFLQLRKQNKKQYTEALSVLWGKACYVFSHFFQPTGADEIILQLQFFQQGVNSFTKEKDSKHARIYAIIGDYWLKHYQVECALKRSENNSPAEALQPYVEFFQEQLQQHFGQILLNSVNWLSNKAKPTQEEIEDFCACLKALADYLARSKTGFNWIPLLISELNKTSIKDESLSQTRLYMGQLSAQIVQNELLPEDNIFLQLFEFKKAIIQLRRTCPLDYYSEFLQQVLRPLFKLFEKLLGSPPCTYTWVLLGSLGRGTCAPYSDIELALLVDKEVFRSHPYFYIYYELIENVLELLGTYDYELEARQVQQLKFVSHGLDSLSFPLFINDQPTELLNTPEQLAESILNALTYSQNDSSNDHKKPHHAQALCLLHSAPLLLTENNNNNNDNDSNNNSNNLWTRYLNSLGNPQKRVAIRQALQKQPMAQSGLLRHDLLREQFEVKASSSKANEWPYFLILPKPTDLPNIIDLKKDFLKPLVCWCEDIWHEIYFRTELKESLIPASFQQLLEKLSPYFAKTFSHEIKRMYQIVNELRNRCQIERLGGHPEAVFLQAPSNPEQPAASLLLGQHPVTLTQFIQLQLHTFGITLYETYRRTETWLQNHFEQPFDPIESYAQEELALLDEHVSASAQEAILKPLTLYLAFTNLTAEGHAIIYAKVPEKYRALYYQCLRAAFNLRYPDNLDFPKKLKQVAMMANRNGWRPIMAETLAFLDKEISYLEKVLNNNNDIQSVDDSESIQGQLIFPDQHNKIQQLDLKAAVVKQIQEKFLEKQQFKLKTKPIEEKNKENNPSRHLVAEITVCDDKVRLHGIYFKLFPEMASMDYFIDRLQNLLVGHGTVPSTLAKLVLKHNAQTLIIPVLLSPTAAEKNLAVLLEKSVINEKQAFDSRKFSELLLMHWLLIQNDGAARNLVLSSFPFGLGSIVCVDNERYFAEPIVRSGPFGSNKEVFFQSCLYCFDQAKERLDKKAIAVFKHYDLQKLLLAVLELGEQREQAYQRLFTPAEAKAFLKQGEDYCFLQMKLREPALPELMIKLCQLQALAFEMETDAIAPTIFELLDARLREYYLKANKPNKPVLARFTDATGAKAYTLSSKQNLKALLPNLKNEQELGQEKSYSLTASEEILASLELSPIQGEYFTLEQKDKVTVKRFLGGEEDQQLYHFVIDFKNRPVSLEQARLLFSLLGQKCLQRLIIKHSGFVDLALLKIALARSYEHLLQLEIQDCQNLFPKEFFPWLRNFKKLTHLHFNFMPKIESLDIAELAFTELDLSNNAELRQLTVNFKFLKTLRLKNNQQLQTINLFSKNQKKTREVSP